MPHLKFRGVDKHILIENSKELIDGLTDIIGCDRTWFTIEHTDTEYIFDNQITSGPIFIDFLWFDRGSETKDQVALFLTEFSKKFKPKKETTVIFTALKCNDYYEDGKHF